MTSMQTIKKWFATIFQMKETVEPIQQEAQEAVEVLPEAEPLLESLQELAAPETKSAEIVLPEAEPPQKAEQTQSREAAQATPAEGQAVVVEKSVEKFEKSEPAAPAPEIKPSVFTVSGDADCPNAVLFVVMKVVADAKGRFSFQVPNGTYTIRPVSPIPGKGFYPETAIVTVNDAAVELNFIDPSSPVDSRVSPNNPRTVQGAIFYDIPSNDSRAIPALTPSFGITSVSAAVGGQTAYTGTFTPSRLPAGSVSRVFGFTNAANNGSFQIVSCTATVLTLANAKGVVENPASGTAISNFTVDSRTAGAPVDCRVAPYIPQNSRV